MKRIGIIIMMLALVLALTACAAAADPWQEQYDLGILYLEEGNYQEAILAFSAAIEIDDKQPDVYYSRGLAYQLSGQPQQAVSDYEKAVELDSTHQDAWFGMLEIYGGERNTEKILELMEKGHSFFASVPETEEIFRTVNEDGSFTLFVFPYELHYDPEGIPSWSILECDGETNRLTTYNADGSYSIHLYTNEMINISLEEHFADGSWSYSEFSEGWNIGYICYYAADGSIQQETYTEYDDQGNRIKESDYFPDGSHFIYEYDNTGNITQMTSYDPDGTTVVTVYNSDGSHTSTVYDPDGSVYVINFDAEGNVIS